MKRDLLTKRDIERLFGVHPALIEVCRRARPFVGFHVIEGKRTAARHLQLVEAGRSWTRNSRHLTGHAVDLMAWDAHGKGTWDALAYHHLAKAMLDAADTIGLPLVWGGTWRQRDLVHFEVPSTITPAALAAVSRRLAA